MSPTDILHELIDVAAGRRNVPPHRADELHEELTPGYTAVPPSDEQIAAAQAILAAASDAQKAQAQSVVDAAGV